MIPVKDEMVHGAGCCGNGEKKQEKVTTVKISPFCRPTRSIDGPKISSHRARKEIMNRRIKGEEEGNESLSRTHHLFVIAYLCTCEGRRRIKGRKKMARGGSVVLKTPHLPAVAPPLVLLFWHFP